MLRIRAHAARGSFAPLTRVAQLCAFVAAWADATGERAALFQKRAAVSRLGKVNCCACASMKSVPQAKAMPIMLVRGSPDSAEAFWMVHAHGENVARVAEEAGRVDVELAHLPLVS